MAAISTTPLTVPVQVDSVVQGDAVVRCTYFCIDCQMPQPNWSIGFGGPRIPMFLLGVSGILLGPVAGETFTQPSEIEDLFERVESVEGFSVEVNDIWIPFNLLAKSSLVRGSVLRIGVKLFQFAFEQRANWSIDDPMWREFGQDWKISAEETEVFRNWEIYTIGVAKERYYGNREHALKWQTRDDDPENPIFIRPFDRPPAPGGKSFGEREIPPPEDTDDNNTRKGSA